MLVVGSAENNRQFQTEHKEIKNPGERGSIEREEA